MNSLGKKVKAFRTAPERKWTLDRMAKEVGTSRQNISNLESKGFGQPRYIADLARVMGTTVDVLLENADGTFTAVQVKPPGQQAANKPPYTLLDLVNDLASHMAKMDPLTREAVANALPRLANAADESADIAEFIYRLASTQKGAQASDNVRSIVASTQSKDRKHSSPTSRLVTSTARPIRRRKTSE
jgi:transcriptional regulator with XRE-family HTH domain